MEQLSILNNVDTTSRLDSTVSSLGDLDGSGGEPPANSLSLDSLFSVVKANLSGLTKDPISGYYYLQGKIGASDQESLYNYTHCVGELTVGTEPPDSRLAPHVLGRIAQLQEPNKVLFPSLHHLRIVEPSSLLDFLYLLLPSTLATLELTAVPNDHPFFISVLSFLESVADQAPHLSTLILTSGQDQILDVSLRYRNLRCLQLLDVGSSITYQWLQDIGSLPKLETFALRNNDSSTYKCSAAIPSGEQNLSSLSTEAGASVPILDPGREFVDSALFSTLQTCDVDAPLDLIKDLMEMVSSDLQVLSIDVTKPLKQQQREESVNNWGNYHRNLNHDGYDYDGDNYDGENYDGDNWSISATANFGKGDALEFFGSLAGTSSFQFPLPSKTLKDDIETLVRRSIQKWANTLVSVSLQNNSSTPFSLPSDIFENLLLRPDIKSLEITGMEIDFMERTLYRLQGSVARSKLEVLHLPLTTPGISLVGLERVAVACPRLESFRCALNDLGNLKVAHPLSHRLKKLSVKSEEPQLEWKLLVDIAHYLYSIFPNINSINADGGNAKEWSSIFHLVKLCQASREVDQRRLSSEKTRTNAPQ